MSGRPRSAREIRQCEGCPATFEVLPSSDRRFCTKGCSNRFTAVARGASRKAGDRAYRPPVCPCGNEVQPPPGLKYVYPGSKKYCSPECRMTYGKKRQKDPVNYVTFDCQTCGESTTRYKNYGNGALKFCSNECAAKYTKTKKHYVVRDMDMVLDSGWEALFAGLMMFLKIPVERIDRGMAVEWSPDHWYAPDFEVAGQAIEIKGLEDDEDAEKWDLWRAQRGPLLVVDHVLLDRLRCCQSAREALSILSGPG